MEAARHLRAASLDGTGWITDALSAALRRVGRLVRLLIAGSPRSA
jgi:hypothetical protein